MGCNGIITSFRTEEEGAGRSSGECCTGGGGGVCDDDSDGVGDGDGEMCSGSGNDDGDDGDGGDGGIEFVDEECGEECDDNEEEEEGCCGGETDVVFDDAECFSFDTDFTILGLAYLCDNVIASSSTMELEEEEEGCVKFLGCKE